MPHGAGGQRPHRARTNLIAERPFRVGAYEVLMLRARNPRTAIIVSIVIAVMCACLVVAASAGTAAVRFVQSSLAGSPDSPAETSCSSGAEPVLKRAVGTPVSLGTLDTLTRTLVQESKPSDLACRLSGKCAIPETIAQAGGPPSAGAMHTFWVSNVETNESFQVEAQLEYVTPHMYFWVQQDADFERAELEALADAFESRIYSTNREFFGSEWSPGIDLDPHIYVLYAGGLGPSIAGYFSAADEQHPLAHEYSNAHEMFLFSADNTDLGSEFTYGVLAHEFQHMIHWYQDRNETSWINEGFSELAAFLNDYDPGGFDSLYAQNPDLQLNDWPNSPRCTSPHYGAGFLFLTYFLDRFGEDATKALVRDPANGFDSVDNVLRSINATDAISGRPIHADDLFMDWVVTNQVLDTAVADGRYFYYNYPGAPRAATTETIATCPLPDGAMLRTVHQYGVDYVTITCPGPVTVDFSGSTLTGLLPEDAYSGDHAFWSNKGDESNMTLTREFDFSEIGGPIELTYRTWYDLEVDYDYLYLEASEDGERWQILTTPSGTAEDPSGNSFGWAYNGVTAGWIEEAIDLSDYAGKKIFLRFEYVTDAAVNGEGLLLDDVSVPAVEYFADFEADDGGWTADGFARVQNTLPQTFRLALIHVGAQTTVEMIPLDADQSARIEFSLTEGERATLVIAGTTRFTREQGAYQIELR
jgi:hypothetical protein